MKALVWLRRNALELVQSMLMLAVLFAIVGSLFYWCHGKLMAFGVTDSLWQSAAVWWLVGLVCAFFWPLRYHKEMQGLWRGAMPQILLVSLTGPLAILLGFPV